MATDENDMAQRMRALYRYLVDTSEDVGRNFAEEVRKIHYHETAYRRIRGIATDEEIDALYEEGIEVMPIDWSPPDAETK